MGNHSFDYLDMNCFFCSSQEFRTVDIAPGFDSKTEYKLMQCHDCQIVRTEPILTNRALNEYYNIEYYGSNRKKFRTIFEKFVDKNTFLRAGKIFLEIRKENKGCLIRVLDVGCGRGTLLNYLSLFGCKCFGVERSNFKFPIFRNDIIFYSEPLDEIEFKSDYFDVVVMWHSLEHFINPAAILDVITRILKTNGLLVLATPNYESIQRKIFRSRWFHLDLPRHTHHFGKKTLQSYLETQGYRIQSVNTFSIEQNPFGFIQSLYNIIPRVKLNHLYSLLKIQKDVPINVELLLWIGISCLLLPFAFFEYIFSGILGLGATMEILAYKE